MRIALAKIATERSPSNRVVALLLLLGMTLLFLGQLTKKLSHFEGLAIFLLVGALFFLIVPRLIIHGIRTGSVSSAHLVTMSSKGFKIQNGQFPSLAWNWHTWSTITCVQKYKSFWIVTASILPGLRRYYFAVPLDSVDPKVTQLVEENAKRFGADIKIFP